MAESGTSRLDLENPWPGLDSFAESDRAYFHGRDAEAADLLTRVRGEPLTVLFGRSGLGKTSLLNAGLFPILRGEDLLPVYIRLVHGAATSLRDQVLIALHAECAAHRVEAPAHAHDETLWEFFHRTGAEFWNARNRPVTPVLVFDQFEEMFTIGRSDAGAQARSAAFLEELGGIIENRAPGHVKEALDNDVSGERRFDFRARNVKIVLSFREDFLADMESLRRGIPSLVHNRFRLNPLSGGQALEAVTRTGGRLVDEDVALRIIGLAGRGTAEPPPVPGELAQLEVDPALLSVLCSELNAKRRRSGMPTLTPDLLFGAQREILSEFYERGVAGLDLRVRAFIEDRLLTAGGFRNSFARDDALAEPGVTDEALQTLVARRLVREDERFGVRRLELTHDILIPVLQASREARKKRQAEAAALAGEREKQKGRRARIFLIAFPAAIVAVVAAAGVALWLVFAAFTEMTHAVEHRRVMLGITLELSHLFEKMNRLGGAFVATGDPRYLEDHAAVTRQRASFRARLKEAGASQDELAVLDEAIDTSEQQHKLQRIAFGAMQGEQKPELALRTLHGAEYEKLMQALEAQVRRLTDTVNMRTAATVKKETDELFVGIVILGSGLGVLLLLTVAALVIIGAYRSPAAPSAAESPALRSNRL